MYLVFSSIFNTCRTLLKISIERNLISADLIIQLLQLKQRSDLSLQYLTTFCYVPLSSEDVWPSKKAAKDFELAS